MIHGKTFDQAVDVLFVEKYCRTYVVVVFFDAEITTSCLLPYAAL